MAAGIIILSGPVGAGKTTVARELVPALAGPTAYIEGDTFWSFIRKGTPRKGGEKNFKMTMAAMTAAAIPYALYGYDVVLDFSVPPWFLDTARKVAEARSVPLDYVVLRPSESVCAGRAAARTEGAIADYSKFHEFYTTFDGAETHTIQDDVSEGAALAVRLRVGLQAGIYRVT